MSEALKEKDRMLKVSVSCGLLTALVFSTAQAPTFHLWSDLPIASADATSYPQMTAGVDAHANVLANEHYAATREYDEDNDLERFELDELFLPKLDVTLPELFDWSDGERTYLANNAMSPSFGFGLDSPNGFAFRNTSAGRGVVSGNAAAIAGAGTSSKGASAAAGSESADSASKGTSGGESNGSTQAAASESESTHEQLAHEPAPPTFTDDSQTHDDQLAMNDHPMDSSRADLSGPIVDTQKPVQVPAPAPLGLFVLGLAALHLVGRKKNGSG
jgi:hypothetical protein